MGLPENNSWSFSPGNDKTTESLPQRIGKFQILGVIGKGGFGIVYLGYDEALQRRVAIKVPRPEYCQNPNDVAIYLKEARTLAQVEHPHIVPVLEVGNSEEFPIYIASKWIDGTDLATFITNKTPSLSQTIQWTSAIADALGTAHKRGFVHRDIKPQNILIDSADFPYLADFGLALRDEDVGRPIAAGGTPAYMSPEQAKGEGHRVDGRSDIFSLGVVVYELTTGTRPFLAKDRKELIRQITETDPKPPRQRNPAIPKEVERICLKMLAKRKTDRYTSIADLLEDLSAFHAENPLLSNPVKAAVNPADTTIMDADHAAPERDPWSPPSGADKSRSLTIVPKGLRAFDQKDKDFFLELLPGTIDRSGLPDSIAFWKQKIGERDPDHTFSVGLIYGPSGCGKSSLVKAGLLPCLPPTVVPVYLEASTDRTEVSMHELICKKLTGLGCEIDNHSDLVTLLRQIRLGKILPSNQKLLVVIDQFEQWLYAFSAIAGTVMIDALKQCDGQRLQTILMVRGDFWMGAVRLFRELDLRIVDRDNAWPVDLFDVSHAQKVLRAFGNAYGKRVDESDPRRPAYDEFIREAVGQLAVDGKVISVQIALFAEMMKGKEWVPETLASVGGMAGVGVTFLEETFSSSAASPEHRYHQKAARLVLRSLLPEAGTDIKGNRRATGELLQLSGYAQRPLDFSSLLAILDGELRLITPADTLQEDEQKTPQAYQLTHDYLVPSLRSWLNQKQRESAQGRAELLLAERTGIWSAKKESRQLPSMLEWLRIHRMTKHRDWTPQQRQLMSAANRLRGLQLFGFIIVLTASLYAGLLFKAMRDGKDLAFNILSSDGSSISRVIETNRSKLPLAAAHLSDALQNSRATEPQKRAAAIGLLALNDKSSKEIVKKAVEDLPTWPPDWLIPLSRSLKPFFQDIETRLLDDCSSSNLDESGRLKSLLVLHQLNPESPVLNGEEVEMFVANQLVKAEPTELQYWKDLSESWIESLAASFKRRYEDSQATGRERRNALVYLKNTTFNQVESLQQLLSTVSANDFDFLMDELRSVEEQVTEFLLSRLDENTTSDSISNSPSQLDLPHQLQQSLTDQGLHVTGSQAVAISLPLDNFVSIAAELKAYGYRPTHVRPRLTPQRTPEPGVFSVIWCRDHKNFHFDASLTQQELRDSVVQREGKLAVKDISQLSSSIKGSQPLFCVLWEEPDGEFAREFVLAGDREHLEANHKTPIENPARPSQVKDEDTLVSYCPISITGFQEPDGSMRYSCVWRQQRMASDLQFHNLCPDLKHRPQWDIGLGCSLWMADPSVTSELLPIESDSSDWKRILIDSSITPVAIGSNGATPSLVVHRRKRLDPEDELAQQWSRRAISLIRLGHTSDVLRVLSTLDKPHYGAWLQSFLIPYKVRFESLRNELPFLHSSDSKALRWLIVALGEYGGLENQAEQQKSLFKTPEDSKAFALELLKIYSENADPGVHSACFWTLTQFGYQAQLADLQKQLAKGEIATDHDWYETRTNLHPMSIIRPKGSFLMGSPVSEIGRFNGENELYESQYKVKIDRVFAIAATEVTNEQYQVFDSTYVPEAGISRRKNDPAHQITWYEAAAYCNWLSEQEGIPPDQWCYLATEARQVDQEGNRSFIVAPDSLKRNGYRLPTEAEWEFACRAGSNTARFFGESSKLFNRYSTNMVWSGFVGTDLVAKQRPNPFGLFDVYGNIMEWCHTFAPGADRHNTGLYADEELAIALHSGDNLREAATRGGAYTHPTVFLRSAYRNETPKTYKGSNVGFRIARTLPK